MLSYLCDFYLLFYRLVFIQAWIANTYHIVPQTIVDFLPNIIQTYQYISCVYRVSVQLYMFENHILVITQQFLVFHKWVQQPIKANYQIRMLVVTATSQFNNYELSLYHRGPRDIHVDRQFKHGIWWIMPSYSYHIIFKILFSQFKGTWSFFLMTPEPIL